MLRYATYRTRVYTVLAAATGLQATCLPAAALASLPDYFRAGLSPTTPPTACLSLPASPSRAGCQKPTLLPIPNP
jgi:hypothetical protein